MSQTPRALVLPALALALGCSTTHRLEPADRPDAAQVVPSGALSIGALQVHRQRPGAPANLPALTIPLTLSPNIAPHALAVRATCASGHSVLVDEGVIQLKDPAPRHLVHLLFGGAPLTALPQRCEVHVHAEPSPGRGAQPTLLAIACVTPARSTPGACPNFSATSVRGPQHRAPLQLDGVVTQRGPHGLSVGFNLTRWRGDGPLPAIKFEAICAQGHGQSPAVRAGHAAAAQGLRTTLRVEGKGWSLPCTLRFTEGDAALGTWCAKARGTRRGPCAPP